MKKKPLLVIIYNHKHLKNIEIIENIYRHRFSHIHHLMPFYQGNKENVTAVYDSSHYFQSYIAQGLSDYYQKEVSHYLFIADDLLLNPAINEDNYQDFFTLNQNNCYIHRIKNLVDKNGDVTPWAYYHFAHEFPSSPLQELDELPSHHEAVQRFKQHNIETKYFIVPGSTSDNSNFTRRVIDKIPFFRHKPTINYPLAYGYSDIVIIPNILIKKFCYYCGIFSSANLHVEMSIPTTLVLISDDIVTFDDLNTAGKNMMSKMIPQLRHKYKDQLDSLIGDFPDTLYIHPIKLSIWNKSAPLKKADRK